MRFGSVCSGIEAASVAWHSLGWQASWLAEIESFPSAVLAHHYPEVPNLGDMTKIAARILSGEIEAPDVLVGGTPCQAFSVAGLRKSLNDERGQLSLAFIHIADSIDAVRSVSGREPAVVVWENVPGVLSTSDNAFGCFLAGLVGEDCELQPAGKKWANAGCVYGPKRAVAWRILDAQYFGVAQRRRRVFVVASARDGFDPAEVLFEREGLRRDSPPRRKSGEEIAPTIRAGAPNGSASHGARSGDSRDELIVPHSWPAEVAPTLNAHFGDKQGLEDQHINGGGGLFVPAVCVTGDIAHTLKAEGFDASEDGTGRGNPIIAFSSKDYGNDAAEGISPTLRSLGGYGANGGGNMAVAFDLAQITSPQNRSRAEDGLPAATISAGSNPAVAVSLRGREGGATAELGDEVGNCLRASGGGGDKAHVLAKMQVRRLTPRECERLQGFPDDYTLIPVRGKPAADGPRYKALGNSMAVPVMRWIGNRIAQAVAMKETA